MMENVIEIKGLSKEYKGFKLEDVSFNVPQGFIMGLIGPNGAGKTTIIKLIMNLIRRASGEIKVFGQDNLKYEPDIKSRIGFVYDVPCFHEDVCLEDIKSALAPFYEKWNDKLFSRLAEEFELPLRSIFKKLPHGMKMKFALSLALSHDADLILMDEPTAGLDPVFRLDLLERLAAIIQNERKSVLFSSHITSDLERIADYITFIHRGKIIFSTAKNEILEKWGVIKLGNDEFDASKVPGFRSFRRLEYSTEILTSDISGAKAKLGPDALYEKATLEDIMYFISKGDANA